MILNRAAALRNPVLQTDSRTLWATTTSGINSQEAVKLPNLRAVSQLQIGPGLGTDNGQNHGGHAAFQSSSVTSNLVVMFAADITSTGDGAD